MFSNNNPQYHLLFLSLSHRHPITPTVHVRARISSRTHPKSNMRVPLFEWGRDQMTYAHGVIIILLCVCSYALRMFITLTPGGTGRREDRFRRWPHRFKRWPPQIQEVAPTTCVVWHFAPCDTLF